MQSDKSAIILEAQWMEQEIPRIEQELGALQKLEQELLTTPMETINQVYTSTYNSERQKARPFYHRRRSITPTRYGYKERMLDVGWFTVFARVLILAAIVWAGYIVYDLDRQDDMTKGIIWGLVVLVVAIGLAFLLGLFFQRKVFFFNRIFMRELILAVLSLVFFINFLARQDKLILLFPQLIFVCALFIYSFKTTLEDHGLVNDSILVKLRKTFLQVDGYQSLSILKQANSFEMVALVLSSGFAWFYFVFTEQVVQDLTQFVGIFSLHAGQR